MLRRADSETDVEREAPNGPDFVTVRVECATGNSFKTNVSSVASVRAVKTSLFRKHPILKHLSPSWFVLKHGEDTLTPEYQRFSTTTQSVKDKWLAREVVEIALAPRSASASPDQQTPSAQCLSRSQFDKVVRLNRDDNTPWNSDTLSDLSDRIPYAETVVLPRLSLPESLSLLEALDHTLVCNSLLTSLQLEIEEIGTITDANVPQELKPIWTRLRSRMLRNSNRIFGVHGGGNIGLGLVADVVSNSSQGYKIVATSSKEWMTSLINGSGRVWLQHSEPPEDDEFSFGRTTCIEGVTMISRSDVDVVKLYCEASIVALCVTTSVMESVAKQIAAGLIARYNIDGSGVKILCCFNTPNPAQFVANTVDAALLSMLKNDRAMTDLIMSCSDFVSTVVDRIVVPIPEETVRNRLQKQLVQKIGDEGQVEEVMNSPEQLQAMVAFFGLRFPLFFAEEKYEFWVPNSFHEAALIPQLKAVNDLQLIEIVKNKFVNGPHAMLAWLAGLFGYETVAEALDQPLLYSYLNELMEEEIAPILLANYPDLEKEHLAEMKENFLERCKASKNDPVTRVGRDPLRKLDRGGRVRGTLEMAQGHETPRLILGCAAGFLYGIRQIDPTNAGCKMCADLYARGGSYASVLLYSGPTPNGAFRGFDEQKENDLVMAVIRDMASLNNWVESHRVSWPQSTASPSEMGVADLQKALGELGITVEEETGHLKYSEEFIATKLDFELLFVRHGETYGNSGLSTKDAKIDRKLVKQNQKDKEKRIFQGNVDYEINRLNAVGRRQAESVAEQIESLFVSGNWFPDMVFVSPLTRTRETALPFLRRNAARLRDLFTVHEGITEMCFGAWENRRVCDMPENNPCHLFYRQQNALIKCDGIDANGIERKGESFAQVILRARAVLLDMNKRCAGQKVLMFSHSMFGAACLVLLGKAQRHISGDFLAFDGKKGKNEYYIMPNATPFAMNFNPPHIKLSPMQALFKGKVKYLDEFSS